MHPDQPGRYVLGVECDGATYHSAKSARDRDRLRQEVLESLGWNIVRVWSTDWTHDHDRQVERVIAAYEEALTKPQAPLPEPAATTGNTEDRNSAATATITSNAKPAESGTINGRSSAPAYANIEEVPPEEIDRLALELLQVVGSVGREDLTRSVSDQLGFRRLGKLIRGAIEDRLQRLERKRRIVVDDGRIRLSDSFGQR